MITGRVLLLNFSYEPLGTIGVARSICMWFSGKLTIEENDGDNVLHSPSTTIPVPSVVRLRTYVHVKRRRQEDLMQNNLLRIINFRLLIEMMKGHIWVKSKSIFNLNKKFIYKSVINRLI